jgi:solute carrier family 25 (mitochondrial dicarboxylate transporter), member 10
VPAALLRQGTYSTVRFGAYDVIKEAAGDSAQRMSLMPPWRGVCGRGLTSSLYGPWPDPLSAGGKVVVGMLAGAAGGVCGSPADIVNIRMQNDGKMPEAARRHYKHALGTQGVYSALSVCA